MARNKALSIYMLLALLLCSCTKVLPFETVVKSSPQANHLTWYVLDVSDNSAQADANLIKFGSGEVFLIDAGQTSHALLPRLRDLGVNRIDAIFISHPHKDHYNGLWSLVDSNISIGKVYFNMPPKSICDPEMPWGCDYGDIEKLLYRLKERSIPVHSAKGGDVYLHNDIFDLRTLYAHDGKEPPVGTCDINDLSLIMSLSAGKIKALFTGDLNQKLGSHLAATTDKALKAQLLKVPHHGTDSLAPNSFFEWVSPEMAFIPAPKSLWLSDRSARARNWFKEQRVPTIVTGISGLVRIDISPDGYRINSAH